MRIIAVVIFLLGCKGDPPYVAPFDQWDLTIINEYNIEIWVQAAFYEPDSTGITCAFHESIFYSPVEAGLSGDLLMRQWHICERDIELRIYENANITGNPPQVPILVVELVSTGEDMTITIL